MGLAQVCEDLSPELSAIIDRSLQYNPQHRYQSAQRNFSSSPRLVH